MRPLGTAELGARVAGEDHVLAARATRVTGGWNSQHVTMSSFPPRQTPLEGQFCQ